MRDKMEVSSQSGTSRRQKNKKAREYRCLASETYKLIKVSLYCNDTWSTLTYWVSLDSI